MENKNLLSKSFLMLLLVTLLAACYFIFRSFIVEMIAAMILVTMFYPAYEQLTAKLKGRRSIASFLMCFFVVLLVIVPLVNFIIFSAHKSNEAYTETVNFINNNNIEEVVASSVLSKLSFINIDVDAFKDFATGLVKNVGIWFYEGASKLVLGTTGFMISMLWIIIIMFFFFIDGSKMLEKVMLWTPLPNRYDKAIFTKFKDVSYSIIMSTFVTAIVQGTLGAIGFLIIGLPAFFAGVFMAIFSLIPYVGTAIVWLPTAIFMFASGKIWQGVFMLIWGVLVIGLSDNVIKAYLIKDKAQVHPIFIIFSILGGISLFGFWGLVFGPLIISLTVTILHIYEMEYAEVLEK
jgi:predicted PurR-regulated permease PerM